MVIDCGGGETEWRELRIKCELKNFQFQSMKGVNQGVMDVDKRERWKWSWGGGGKGGLRF